MRRTTSRSRSVMYRKSPVSKRKLSGPAISGVKEFESSMSNEERAHFEATTRYLLPRPARNGRGEGHPIKSASSPQPSPPAGEEGEATPSAAVVVVARFTHEGPDQGAES